MEAILDIMRDMIPPAMTSGGIEDNMTRERSHPLVKAIINPPKNVDTSCKNFPTYENKGRERERGWSKAGDQLST